MKISGTGIPESLIYIKEMPPTNKGLLKYGDAKKIWNAKYKVRKPKKKRNG